MKKNLVPILFLTAMLSGCTTRTITLPNGASYKSTRFANKESIGAVRVTGPDGITVEIESFNSDQVQGLSAVTAAAVGAALKAK